MHSVGAVAAAPAGRITHHHDAGWLAWVAIGLALVAGFVDAVGFLALFRLYAAHMSGNTASAGADLGRLDWGSAAHASVPIGAFVLGVCIGASIKQEGVRRGVRPWFAATCLLEAVLLAPLIVMGPAAAASGALVQNSAEYLVLVALPCLAMGVQSASFQRVGSVGVRTTFVTGILTGLGEEVTAFLYNVRARREGLEKGAAIAEGPLDQGTLERAALFGGIWAAYLVGGILAGVSLQLWQLTALALPVAALLGLAALDLRHPIQPGRP